MKRASEMKSNFRVSMIVMKELILLTVFAQILKAAEGNTHGVRLSSIKIFPHAVFLSCFCQEKAWNCGGSILNDRLVLTAGHCFIGCFQDHGHKVHVFAGHDHLDMMKEIRRIARFVVHERLEVQSGFCDIAIGVTTSALIFGDSIKRIWIAPTFPGAGSEGSVAGWGFLNDFGTKSKTLKSVAHQVQSPSVCKIFNISLGGGMFCVTTDSIKTLKGGTADSGSALIMPSQQQIGILVYNYIRTTFPPMAVYTNVSSFYRWIYAQSIRVFCATKRPRF